MINLLIDQFDAIAYAVAWAMFDSLWQFLVVGMILRIILWWIPNAQSAFRYHLALAALVFCGGWWLSNATFHYISFQQNSKNIVIEKSQTITANETVTTSINPVIALETSIQNSQNTEITMLEQEQKTFKESISNWISAHKEWLLTVWLLGVITLLIRFWGSWLYLKTLRTRELSSIGDEWQNRLQLLKSQLNINQYIQLALSPLVKEPITFGHFKPIILIPIGLINQLSTEEVEAILLHELAHIKRHDFLVNVLQSCLEIILFYHPVTWWLNHIIRNIREECCDDLAVHIQKDEQLYAQTLLQVHKYSLITQNHLIMTATGKKSALTQRIHRLFNDRSTQKRSFSFPLVILFLMMSGLTLFAFQNIRQQPVVSISTDKLKVFYYGVENPITVAVEGINNEDLKVSSNDVELTSLGNGQYSVKPLKLGKAIINVEANHLKRDITFTVKKIPTPFAKGNFNNLDVYHERSGIVSVEEMKAMQGLSTINLTEFDVKCEVVYFEFTRVPVADDPITEVSRGSDFKGRAKDLKDLAAIGDVYYMDKIRVKCPGDKQSRELRGMFFKIR